MDKKRYCKYLGKIIELEEKESNRYTYEPTNKTLIETATEALEWANS